MPNKSRERALENALLRLYERWWRELGYRAERFRQTIVPGCKRYKGGVQAVRDILQKLTQGFAYLKKHPRMTVEYLVMTGDWDDLFTDDDRRATRQKLSK